MSNLGCYVELLEIFLKPIYYQYASPRGQLGSSQVSLFIRYQITNTFQNLLKSNNIQMLHNFI